MRNIQNGMFFTVMSHPPTRNCRASPWPLRIMRGTQSSTSHTASGSSTSSSSGGVTSSRIAALCVVVVLGTFFLYSLHYTGVTMLNGNTGNTPSIHHAQRAHLVLAPWQRLTFAGLDQVDNVYREGDVLKYNYTTSTTKHPTTNYDLVPQQNFTLSHITASILNTLESLDYDNDPLTPDDMAHIPVVVGASANHYQESIGTILSYQRVYPDSKLYYYDLGLSDQQRKEISTFCNVVVRHVNFHLYPEHVRNLFNYAFKLVVWQDMLRRHAAFIWLDASIRIKPCFPQHVIDMYDKLTSSGIVMLHPSPHTVYATTTPALYRYLPTNFTQFREMRAYGGGAVIFSRNRSTVTEVIKWLTVCSLERDCIMPSGHNLYCVAHNPRKYQEDYLGCHRYDMAILGILLANHFKFQQHMYTDFPEKCFHVKRLTSDQRPDKKQVKTCDTQQ